VALLWIVLHRPHTNGPDFCINKQVPLRIAAQCMVSTAHDAIHRSTISKVRMRVHVKKIHIA
jgi:hypothetical protein